MQKPKQKTTKQLKDALWKIVSQVVRRQGADLFREINTCFTCGKTFPIKKLNAGHFKHNKLDFDLRNLKPQCVHCNLWNSGELDVYGIKLVRIYGLEWVEQLERDAVQKGNDYSREELLLLMEEFKLKLNQLK